MRIRICSLLILMLNTIVTLAQTSSATQATLHLDWIDDKTPVWKNFYAYANGAWQQRHPIPADYASWDNFRILQQATQKKLQNLMKFVEAR